MAASAGFQRRQAFRDTSEQFRMFVNRMTPDFYNRLQQMAAPSLAAIQAQGALMGATVGQNFASSLGALGGGSTGVGNISRSIASSLTGYQAAQARAQANMQLLQSAFEMAGQGASGGLSAYQSTQPSDPWGSVGRALGTGALALGGFMVGGPVGAAAGAAAGRKAFGGGGGSQADINRTAPFGQLR